MTDDTERRQGLPQLAAEIHQLAQRVDDVETALRTHRGQEDRYEALIGSLGESLDRLRERIQELEGTVKAAGLDTLSEITPILSDFAGTVRTLSRASKLVAGVMALAGLFGFIAWLAGVAPPT